MSDKPEIIGGPFAHMLAEMVQRMQKESGSQDIDIVEVDKDGNEVRRVRMKNAKLLRVEVSEDSDAVEHVTDLKFERDEETED